jgi:hypothetical protein
MKGQLDGRHDVIDIASNSVLLAQIVYLSKRKRGKNPVRKKVQLIIHGAGAPVSPACA